MADVKAAAASPFPSQDVSKDWLSRLADARTQKSVVEKDLQEAYFFTRPRLSRQVSSTSAVTAKTASNEDAAAELATSIGSEVSEDFATEALAAFFPPGTNWAESTADAAILAGLEAGDVDTVKGQVKQADDVVFAAIRTSNFNAEIATALDPDAGIGTIGLWIDTPGAGRPYKVDHVPTRELEFNVDPDGSPGDRFRVRHVRGDQLRSVIGTIALPEKITTKIKRSPSTPIEVVWCFRRDWSKPADDVFLHCLLVDKTAVHETTLNGEGSLPLIVMRFSPDKLHSWGNGPAIKSLPDFRVLDVITAATQDRVDVAVAPPIGYPDDGVVNFEGGIEAGKAYPMRPGSGRDVTKLYFEGDADLGFYTAADLERKIRRKFFADYPEQKGDTPPTATQWIDEMVRAQRRIGTPGLKFWDEGPRQIFRRFAWLLEKDGKLPELKISGTPISLTPNNPATQAQDNQKLQVATQLLGIVKSYFPVTSQAAIDELRTIEKMQKLVKDEIIVLRDPSTVEKFVGQLLSHAAGDQGGSGGPAQAQ
jgi:hypothetical protein